MHVTIPDPALVVLIGISASGKTTFARRHFKPTEVLSSDHLRALVSDDENDLSASADAFATLRFIAERRLRRRKLTVIDATNLSPGSRKPLVALARRYGVVAVAIALDLSHDICQERNHRARNLPGDVLQQQANELRRSLERLPSEGFGQVCLLDNPRQVDDFEIERGPAAPAVTTDQTQLEL